MLRCRRKVQNIVKISCFRKGKKYLTKGISNTKAGFLVTILVQQFHCEIGTISLKLARYPSAKP